MRRFLIVGQKASSTEDFLLDDLPGTSGRLDVLVRCLRAALLTSHGVRQEVVVYLLLLGGPLAPRVMRVAGAGVRFLRPDERSLAVLVRKVLATRADEHASGLVGVRPGIATARGGVEVVLEDSAGAAVLVLDEHGADIRGESALDADDLLFVIGDHLGIPDHVRHALDAASARRMSVGPTSIHADDVVAVVTNEVDRRRCR